MKYLLLIFSGLISCTVYSQDQINFSLEIELLQPNREMELILYQAHRESTKCLNKIEKKINFATISISEIEGEYSMHIFAYDNFFTRIIDFENIKLNCKGGFYYKDYFVVVENSVYSKGFTPMLFEKTNTNVNFPVKIEKSEDEVHGTHQIYEYKKRKFEFLITDCIID